MREGCFQRVQTADAHRLADAGSTVRNIVRCSGDGQVETDPLSCFNRTAILIHDPFDIRFGRSSSAIRCHQIWSNCKEQIKMAQKISPRLTLL